MRVYQLVIVYVVLIVICYAIGVECGKRGAGPRPSTGPRASCRPR